MPNCPPLFSLAYRLLGSITDAEDTVQEAYLRWQQAGPVEVESPRNYLCTITTRLCINPLRSARARREEYVGPWLPEPLVSRVEEDPLERMQLAEFVSMAFLLLLERPSKMERAVFLLREVFTFDYAEVARIVGRRTVTARQIAKRAGRARGGAARFTASRKEAERLARRSCGRVRLRGHGSLLDSLAGDVVSWNDGGGKTTAARKLVRGRERVARLYLGLFRKWRHATLRFAHVNGQPGILARAIDGWSPARSGTGGSKASSSWSTPTSSRESRRSSDAGSSRIDITRAGCPRSTTGLGCPPPGSEPGARSMDSPREAAISS